MIYLTFDIDWAPDFILEEVLELLEIYNVRSTFFATHESNIINGIMQKKHEMGIHPNFNPNFEGRGENFPLVLNRLLNSFPDAIGVRFHSLGYNSHVIKYCSEHGISYDSSIYLPIQIKPYEDYSKIYRIPFQCSDFQMIIDNKLSFDLENYNKSLPYVLTFHPIHIFLNTSEIQQYYMAKPYLNDYKKLMGYKNNYNEFGIRTTLEKLLKLNIYNFGTLKEALNVK